LGQLEDVLHAVDDLERARRGELADVSGVEEAVLVCKSRIELTLARTQPEPLHPEKESIHRIHSYAQPAPCSLRKKIHS
jgi:hypothetical protein